MRPDSPRGIRNFNPGKNPYAPGIRWQAACHADRLLLTEIGIDVKSPPQKISLHSEKELRCNG